MQNFSLTIKHVVKNLITIMGISVFAYNTVTPNNGVLYCGDDECGEDCECECGQDCGDCEE